MKYCIFLCVSILLVACNVNKGKYDAYGTFEATEILVSSEASGKILSLDIKEGDKLEEQQVVGCVDSIQFYLKIKQLAAGIHGVNARKPDVNKQIAVLKQQIATAKNEQQRYENLVKAKAGNQKQLDDITNNIIYLQKQLDAHYSSLTQTTSGVDAEVESMEYQILQLDDQLKKCRIVNAHKGVVLIKYAEQGEITVAGKPIYKIADVDLLYLRTYITVDQLSTLQLNQAVRVFANCNNAYKEYPGVISWISDKAEFTPKGIQTKDERANMVFAIKIAVKNDGYLKIGQYGEVLFHDSPQFN